MHNVHLPPILEAIEAQFPLLRSRLLNADRDQRANYLTAQLVALEVGASIEPLESYKPYQATDKGEIDLRESSFECYTTGKPDLSKVTILGRSRGELWIGSGAKVKNVLINAGNSYFTVVLGPCCDLVDCVIQAGSGSTYLVLGSGVTMPIAKIVVQEEKQYVAAGDDCMFSNDVAIRTSDSHGIFDVDTGRRINHARPVRIGQHVWIGRHASINKGATIGSNVVLGQGSIASGLLEPSSIYAGVPAKLMQSNVTWSRYLAPTLEEALAPAAWKVRDNAIGSSYEAVTNLLGSDESQLTSVERLSRWLHRSWQRIASEDNGSEGIYNEIRRLRSAYVPSSTRR